MSFTAQPSLLPAYIWHEGHHPLSEDELQAVRAGQHVTLPTEWEVITGTRLTMRTEFAAADDPAVVHGVILGATDEPRPNIVAIEPIPLVWLHLQRGEETCDIEIAVTRTELARTWAQSITRGGTLQETPLGRVGSGGATAVIDGGERLVRATYDDSQKGTGDPQDDLQHFERLRAGAQQFLADLVVASQAG